MRFEGLGVMELSVDFHKTLLFFTFGEEPLKGSTFEILAGLWGTKV